MDLIVDEAIADLLYFSMTPCGKPLVPMIGREHLMNIYESAEDYLEQILMLLEKKGHARSVDIAAGLNVSKPSVSVAMKKLRENGYISMSSDNLISLTDKGYAIARKIYDRHQALTKFLVGIGVPEDIAREDACKIEHDLSEESFTAICRQIENDAPANV